MIHLTTDLSPVLLSLLPQHPGIIDGVEVGPWYSPEQVRDYRQQLPDLTFYFHGADLVQNIGLRPGTVAEIRQYLAATGSPWISLHLSAWIPRWLRGFLSRGWPLPPPNPSLDARRLIWQIRWLARAIDVPILLENVEPLPWPGYAYYAQPAWIHSILNRIGCALLLDTGHARVAAAHFDLDPVDYINQLPLERVIQVHASGPREQSGRLVDAHEPLQEEDYDLLEYLLDKTHPRVVTLEYIHEPQELLLQLVRLRNDICS